MTLLKLRQEPGLFDQFWNGLKDGWDQNIREMARGWEDFKLQVTEMFASPEWSAWSGLGGEAQTPEWVNTVSEVFSEYLVEPLQNFGKIIGKAFMISASISVSS